MLTIKVLGSGCKNCTIVENRVKEAIQEANIEAKVLKVEDIAEIMKYGVMSTPALVINDEVISTGKVLSVNDILKILAKY